MIEYLSEIKIVVDELAAIDNLIPDQNVVRQVLISLGPEYNAFCTTLKLQPKLPTFEELKTNFYKKKEK